jgi:hypothetical protein
LKKKSRILFSTIFDSRLIVPIPPVHTLYLPAVKCRNCKFVAFISTRDVDEPAITPKSFMKKCVECSKEIPVASEECPYCGAKQKT